MPKQVWKIERFDGGLNTNADPRDLADHELASSVDIAVSDRGKIITMGGNTAHDAGLNGVSGFTGTLVPGYGLYQFSHDRTGAEDAGSSEAETGDDYLAMYDDDDQQVWIYSRTGDTWNDDSGSATNGVIDIGSTGSAKPVFYSVDGALRISDGNFGANNQNKWYGYIKQTHFNGVTPGGVADAYDGWYSKSLDLAAPTGGVYGPAVAFTDTTASSGNTTTDIEYGSGGTDIFRYWNNFDGEEYIAISTDGSAAARVITKVQDTGGGNHDDLVTVANAGDWATEAIELYPPIGKGFNVYFDNSTSTSGSWLGGTYQVGTTFIYQGGQESQVFDISANGNRSIGSDNVLSHGSALSVKIFATSPYDPFIIGGRVYIRKSSLLPWILLADISLRDGARIDLTSPYTAWTLRTATGSGDAPSNVYLTVDLEDVVDASPWTYEAINGYQADESVDIGAVGEGFKTAVVANRQIYIGNVRREDKDGNTQNEGDTMYKSMPGKFDTFPIARKIEASIRDGDEIVKLEEYADRILQFKKNKMHLINISQDVEFLEDTFMHKGVAVPGAVCKTDFGIAWVNKFGCYLYDGKRVNNLLEKGGMQIIKESEWNTFTTNEPMIGYVPKKRQLIVVDDNTSTGTGKTFLYDMVTQSWVKGSDATFTSADLTDFITDWNGDLIHAHTSGTVVKWDDSTDASSGFAFSTKDIDFGNPAVRKKVYKAYVSYKGDGSAVTIGYQTDGETSGTLGNFYRITSNTDGSTSGATDSTLPLWTSTAGTSDWLKAELKPVTSINNISSFQLVFGGTAAADFEINDISIIYRMKNIR